MTPLSSKRWFVAAATFALFVFAAGDVFAAGFYLPGRGVKPLGRAGAYVASGEQNLNSLWYNPANLGGMEKFQLTVDLGLIGLNFRHTRAPRELDNGEVRTYEEIHNQAPPKVDPQLLMGGPIGPDGLSWAFGIYAPYLAGHTFPEDGPQRYVLVDNDQSLAAFFHLALAYEINDRVRVGAGFQNAPASFSLVNVASGYTGLFGDPEDEDLDILTKITLTDLFVPSGNAGVWVKISENLQAGLSGQLPFVFRANKAKLTARLPSHPEFQSAELQGDTLSATIKFPPIVRGGIRVLAGIIDTELAVTWEGWSILSELNAVPNDIAVTNLPGLGSVPVGPLTVPLEWEDTFSVRLGTDLRLDGPFTPRFGYLYEKGAIPDQTYSVFLADANKHVISLGGTYEISDTVSIDAGFAYYLMPNRTITNSKWRQINPTDDEGKVTLVVANGEYKQTYIAGGLGVNLAF